MRTLLVPDVPGWAWARRCEAIKKYGSPTVTVICEGDLDQTNFKAYSSHLICSPFTFTSPDRERSWALVANEGCKYALDPASEIFQHRMATKTKNLERAKQVLPLFRGLACVNLRLVPFLREINPNVAYLRTGVDPEVFREISAPFQDRELRIGWAGKPSTKHAFSPKGYDEVLRPLMRSFDLEPRIEFAVNPRTHADRLPTSQMVQFYNDIDVFLVTSCSEGTPNCALEAMACGRPVIATNVGILSEVNAVAQAECGSGCVKLVPAYRNASESLQTISDLRQEIASMLKDRNWAMVASKTARRTMEKHFNWKGLANEWLDVIRGAPSLRDVSETPGTEQPAGS